MKPNMKPLELKFGESIIIKKKVKTVPNGDKKCQRAVYVMHINRNDGTKQRISSVIEKAGVLYYE